MTDSIEQEANKLYRRGRFYLDSGLTEEAIEVLAQVTDLVPGSPRAWSTLAEAHLRVGDRAAADAAEARSNELLNGQPGNEDARSKGRVFEVKGPGQIVVHRPDEKEDNRDGEGDKHSGTDAIPDEVKAHVAAYKAQSDKGDWVGAEQAARAIIAVWPDDAKAWGSLGLALRYQFQLDAAVGAHKRAAELAPDTPSFLGALAKSCWEAGDFERAETLYGRLLAEMDAGGSAVPEDDVMYADTRLAAAMLTMLRGDLATGLEDYEWRWKTGKIQLPPVPQPMWDGTSAPGQTILFYGEQGFGDAIQFARFIPRIAESCAKVIVPCKPAVKRLIGTVGGNVEITDETVRKDSFDQYIPAMSCMRAFGMREQSIPADVPYLSADPADIVKFRALVGDGPELKVGIAWTGSPTNTISWKKTIDPNLFGRLREIPNTALFSLQVSRDDMPDVVKRVPDGITDMAPHLADFADTAAAIECLDLVITVDTAVAHLAGALAKPVWTMLPFVPDWRWFLDRADTPWYPTMRLFRQQVPGDWRSVLADVAAALTQFRPDAPKPQGSDERVAGAPKKSLLGRLFGGDD